MVHCTVPYDEDYYRDVCGERQTRFDRARDDRVVRLVRRHAPPRTPASALLDIGCGYGHLLSRFRRAYGLCGIELSAHAAERVTEARIPGAAIVRADVRTALPFRTPFDVVLAVNVVEHLDDPDSAVAHIRESTVPGGLCVVHLPTINNAVSRAVYRLAYAGDPTHVYRPSGTEVRDLFERNGFRMLEDSYAPHTPWLLAGLGWHPAYLAAFRRTPGS